MASELARLGRRFLVPDAVLLGLELVAIGVPLGFFFPPFGPELHGLLRVGPAALAVAGVAWLVITRAWRAPIREAARELAEGRPLSDAQRAHVHRAALHYPERALSLRVALWTAVGATVGLVLAAQHLIRSTGVVTVVTVCALHALGINVFRSLWYARLLTRARVALSPGIRPLRWFAESYRQELIRGALCTGAAGIASISVFTVLFVPINLEQYLRLDTFFPATIGVLGLVWFAYVRRLPAPVDRYLKAMLASPSIERGVEDPRAAAAYRAAQIIPYKLALTKVVFWWAAGGLLVVQGVFLFHIDLENAILMCGEIVIVTLGVALYEGLWHRATMRPLLAHIAAWHRPPPDAVRTPLSLRWKMLVSFGALTLFACGLSLFWSFMQYKTLATDFIQRESELRLQSTLADLRERDATRGPLTQEGVIEALKQSFAPGERHPAGEPRPATSGRHLLRDQAIVYYLPPATRARPIALTAGGQAPPPLPWSGEALLRRREGGQMELSDLHLSGTYERLYVARGVDRQDLGAIAVLYPGYRGRGPSLDRQIKELVAFFFILLAISMGIVILVATDLTRPIRELERRAGVMARGDLSRPVVSAAGEADEVGRLTFAFEEMRRALNEKIQSQLKMNQSLEDEVGRRTAELERRNTELNQALDRLGRTQDELLRSEKMASMGRLVAGIAHEINNPINAVVNTVGPLETTLEELVAPSGAEQVADVKSMIRVIQRGAHRTKEIVQALHNYSRGDEDRMVDVDLHRGIDESLELLRHHLKNSIAVERDYQGDGRLRGHAGQLHQVFVNLLTNAAQALGGKPGGGTIRIATRREADALVVAVSDDGPGIEPDVLPHIFDPFFTTKDVGEGSGLGLSIVHGIVERHRGSIAVDSQVGRGTTFTVRLPVDPAQPPA